jgi:5-methylcytosine-specific restriction endonuclease McrA
MDEATRQLVRDRAGGRCEYCRIWQADDAFYRFHVEHIIARQHGGSDELDNLALACHHCNLHKGPNLTAIDPASSALVPLFHPRRQRWEDHFVQRGTAIAGISPGGRATVSLLQMNAPSRLEVRRRAV